LQGRCLLVVIGAVRPDRHPAVTVQERRAYRPGARTNGHMNRCSITPHSTTNTNLQDPKDTETLNILRLLSCALSMVLGLSMVSGKISDPHWKARSAEASFCGRFGLKIFQDCAFSLPCIRSTSGRSLYVVELAHALRLRSIPRICFTPISSS